MEGGCGWKMLLLIGGEELGDGVECLCVYLLYGVEYVLKLVGR